MFGESHLAVLYLTDFMVRSTCSDLPLTGLFPSRAVNFYQTIGVYGLVKEWLTSPSNHVTKSDDEPNGVKLVESHFLIDS